MKTSYELKEERQYLIKIFKNYIIYKSINGSNLYIHNYKYDDYNELSIDFTLDIDKSYLFSEKELKEIIKEFKFEKLKGFKKIEIKRYIGEV